MKKLVFKHKMLSAIIFTVFLLTTFIIAIILLQCEISKPNDEVQINTKIYFSEEWNLTWGGPNGDYGCDLKIAPDGKIYLIGRTYSYGAGNADIVLVKYHPNGTKIWNITWGGVGDETGKKMIFDSNGNLYVIGYTSSFKVGNSNLVLIKIFSNGTIAWNTTWGGPNIDYGMDIIKGTDNMLYTCGWTLSYSLGIYDFSLVKFYDNGTKVWNVTWGGTGTDGANGIVEDSNGYFYVTGFTASYGYNGSTDMAILKFDSDGNIIWNKTWGGSEYDIGEDLIIGNDGNIYVAGTTESYSSGLGDAALVKFSTDGILLNNISWGGINQDVGNEIDVDNSGNIYIAGSTESYGAGNKDLAVLKYWSNETLTLGKLWGSVNEERVTGIDISNDNYIYSCGSTNNTKDGDYDAFLVKFKINVPQTTTTSAYIPGFELIFIIMGLFALLFLCKSKKTNINFKK